MLRVVNIHIDPKLGISKISTRPAGFSVLLFLACGIGLSVLPTSEYRHDYVAYISLLFLMGLTTYYFLISWQAIVFYHKAHIHVRKGFRRWDIAWESVTGGYTTYQEKTSRQSLAKTHFLDLELLVKLPDNPKHEIRNGKANIFHYGFSYWGSEQEHIWLKFNEILNDNGIPNLTKGYSVT